MVDAIDTHAHFIPRSIRREPGRNLLWPSIEVRGESAAVIVGGKLFRVIDCRSWDATRRFDDMAADDVDVQVVSPMPELLPHWFPPADTDALCCHVNEGIAMLCAHRAPPFHWYRDGADAGRFARGAPHRGDQVDRPARYQDRHAYQRHNAGRGRLHAIYAALERAGLMLMIHPLHPLGLERMGGFPELAAVPAFPLETTFAAMSLMTLGPDGAPAAQRG